jgi:hypothetical protein
MAERAELGGVVRERVRAGGLSGSERNALRAACERSGTYLGARKRVDERLAILLAWLHVSSGRPSAGSSPMTTSSRSEDAAQAQADQPERRMSKRTTMLVMVWPGRLRVAAGESVGRDRTAAVIVRPRFAPSRATGGVWMRYRPSKTKYHP